MRLNINNNEVIAHTVRLERLRKHALPSAVRGTLNDAAFDVKTKTMLDQSRKDFINRSPNFFKANSSVDMARGLEINNMRATVGFIESRLRLGGNNFAVKDLEQQEYSGRIGGKSFVPLDTARKAGHASLVKPANRLSRILKANKIVIARNIGRGNKRQRFLLAVQRAGTGGYVLGSTERRENILWRVDSFEGRNRFSLTPLYSYSRGRKIKVKETSFMRTSSLRSGKKMNDFYRKQATFWINKYKK